MPGSLTRRLPGLLLTAALLPALVTSCSHDGETSEPSSEAAAATSSTAAAPVDPVCEGVSALSTRDKLAQLVMVGVRDAGDARAVVADHHVGGIFIGSWTDLALLTDGSLKEIKASQAPSGPLPLAVSVDEEGGRVSRLSSLIGTSPSAKELAQTSSAEQVRELAAERGRKMADLGITVDFAPVVDVVDSDTDDDTVIGDRSFGSDPAKVTEYAGAYAQGLRDAGLLPVLKHFPGHGHGSGDSHTAGAVITPPLTQLLDGDLSPYRTLVTAAPVAVMMGHLEVPGLTEDPASLSPAAVNLLRTGTGYGGPAFDGPVFSDDLSSMAAITEHYGVAEAVLRSLAAGVDIALWVTTDEVPAVLDRLEQALSAGELKQEAVDASLARVTAAKLPGTHCHA
ncbi:glycoside hydrolase family 3 N-terminal domain-containing protein [Mycolicibacter arupensis]|jgi:beta-N-acetylhexosaminidase|uniref:beta-N-acetylhexosaminidase n=1 Tax=Mycolicibacter arupensis TaxID=342002 RepID=A0A5B1MKN8_9MYCO|nr:glycoside hydrolase family 3 N-terminal domain-containing protein [Mycolicibacter arupensis]KAA1432517.1 glycoside hydrolase family 3 protein [Mycolicibacter arupensis]TXI60206.1 MAG: glycoside hydrolase family 3 protein [Mycolicibacter arupensis]